ncbi:hypothetical protein FN846DRAFT_902898 [Sphaerosporella brunnea]|uniref:Uncharacterized protein n=1 Tax=Sphaerosporella brunnea TaxID=1250544 RepID=A0A5J5F8N6_9PEZI|nr:hypothetical protein FN846DRAFT_902898 [Sphaerosporella brunnea]
MTAPSKIGESDDTANALLKLQAGVAEDLAQLAALASRQDSAFTERLRNLDASSPSACSAFLSSLAADRAELQALRHSVEERQQKQREEFMEVQREAWLKAVPGREARADVDKQWTAEAQEAKKTFDKKWDAERNKADIKGDMFRKAITALKEVRGDGYTAFMELSDKVAKNLIEVKEQSERELEMLRSAEPRMVEKEERIKESIRVVLEIARKIDKSRGKGSGSLLGDG